MKLNINGFEDRRKIASILADNGYKVRIIKKQDLFGDKYFVVIEERVSLNKEKNE